MPLRTQYLQCEWCGNMFVRPSDRGPEPKYCKPSHRTRAFEAHNLLRMLEPDLQRAVVNIAEQNALTINEQLAEFARQGVKQWKRAKQ
jgi:hypothetical protein